MLANMAIGAEASELLTYRSAWENDQGRPNTYYASIAKALAADVAMECTTNAVQVGLELPLHNYLFGNFVFIVDVILLC